jgi:sulfur transfer complex TusBCD TusB component (DsrH family)
MELRHLRYFVAVADERNFTRAAERLSMAQPPLSRQIQQLEEELGVVLIEKGTRPLKLTEAGRFFHAHAQELLARAADLMATGYIRRLAPRWSIDLIGQAEFYRDRRETGSSKDPMVRAYGHLRYHLGDASHLALSLRYTAGAREKLGAAELAGRKDDTNGTLTFASFVSPQLQLQAQVSRDLHVENGPKLTTIALQGLYAY